MQKLTRMRQDMNTNENKAKKGDKINKILLSYSRIPFHGIKKPVGREFK